MLCDYCGPLFFPDRESLEFHMRAHHNENPGRRELNEREN
jgi:hypothetical protein